LNYRTLARNLRQDAHNFPQKNFTSALLKTFNRKLLFCDNRKDGKRFDLFLDALQQASVDHALEGFLCIVSSAIMMEISLEISGKCGGNSLVEVGVVLLLWVVAENFHGDGHDCHEHSGDDEVLLDGGVVKSSKNWLGD
jgi:hypothetical protein